MIVKVFYVLSTSLFSVHLKLKTEKMITHGNIQFVQHLNNCHWFCRAKLNPIAAQLCIYSTILIVGGLNKCNLWNCVTWLTFQLLSLLILTSSNNKNGFTDELSHYIIYESAVYSSSLRCCFFSWIFLGSVSVQKVKRSALRWFPTCCFSPISKYSPPAPYIGQWVNPAPLGDLK